jgi:hypothetical protein
MAEAEGRVAARGEVGRSRSGKLPDLIKEPHIHFTDELDAELVKTKPSPQPHSRASALTDRGLNSETGKFRRPMESSGRHAQANQTKLLAITAK